MRINRTHERIKTVVLYILVTIAVTLVVSEYIDAQNDFYRSQIEYTQIICHQAHSEIDGASEEECGRMQDETGTQFECDINGSNCWLGVK